MGWFEIFEIVYYAVLGLAIITIIKVVRGKRKCKI